MKTCSPPRKFDVLYGAIFIVVTQSILRAYPFAFYSIFTVWGESLGWILKFLSTP
jgi:hypothetical protein